MGARLVGVLLASALLVRCGQPVPSRAPRTVQQAIKESLSHNPTMPLLSEPEIKVSRSLPGATAVLVTYETHFAGARSADARVLMVESMVLGQQGRDWFVSSSKGTSYPIDAPLPPISFGGSGGGGLEPLVAQASGIVTDPTVQHIAVTFSDGTRDVVPVEHGTYLVVKQGAMSPTLVEALDVQGSVLYQETLGH